MKRNYLHRNNILNCINAVAISAIISGCVQNHSGVICREVSCSKASSSHAQGQEYTVRAGQFNRSLVCQNPEQYTGKIIGDGHCVSLIKACTNAPHTSSWRPGAQVTENVIPSGTIIATFKGQRYPNRSGWHAAIYSHEDRHGIWVWDQWQGKSVGLRLIRHIPTEASAKPANRSTSYRVVQFD